MEFYPSENLLNRHLDLKRKEKKKSLHRYGGKLQNWQKFCFEANDPFSSSPKSSKMFPSHGTLPLASANSNAVGEPALKCKRARREGWSTVPCNHHVAGQDAWMLEATTQWRQSWELDKCDNVIPTCKEKSSLVQWVEDRAMASTTVLRALEFPNADAIEIYINRLNDIDDD